MSAVAGRLDSWASTLPWDCLVRTPTNCVSATHQHSPMVGQICAVPGCGEPLVADEVCYYVTQYGRDERGNERAVCWRHVVDEPIRV